VTTNVFGHFYQTGYLDLFDKADQNLSWALNLGSLSWDALFTRIMQRREDNLGKDFHGGIFPNDDYRNKLAVLIMLFNSLTDNSKTPNALAENTYAALAQIYRFDRETRAKGKAYLHADLLAKGIYNSHKFNVIPFLESFGLFPSDEIKNDIYGRVDARIPCNLHYITGDAKAISVAESENLFSKHSLVFPEKSREMFGTAKITIDIDDIGFESIKGKKVKIKDGSNVLDEIKIVSKEVSVKSIPAGAYTIVLPAADAGKYVSGNNYLTVKDGENAEVSVSYEKPKNPVGETMELVIAGASNSGAIFAVVKYSSAEEKIIIENSGAAPHWLSPVNGGTVYAGLRIVSGSTVKLTNNYNCNQTFSPRYQEVSVNVGDEIQLWHAEAGQRCYVRNAVTYERNTTDYQIVSRSGDRDPETTTHQPSITLVVTERGLFQKGTADERMREIYSDNFDKLLENAKKEMGEEKWNNLDAYINVKSEIINASKLLSDADRQKFLNENAVLFESGGATPINKTQPRDRRDGILLENSIVSHSAKISVIIPERAEIKMVIYDNVGNVVFDRKGASVIWDLTNSAGRFVANGSYLVVVEAKGQSGKVYLYSAKLGVKR
jgi:hypothetical protein